MSFVIIEVALVAFALMFGLQIILARISRPKSEDKFIIKLFVVFPFLLFLAAWAFNFFALLTFTEALSAYFLFFVLASSWVASYPAVYAVAPTLYMSYILSENKAGITAEKIRQQLNLKENSKDRIADAVHDNWIKKQGEQVFLTSTGWVFVYLFGSFRRLLGLKPETL